MYWLYCFQGILNMLTFLLYLVKHVEEGNGNPLQYSCLENPMVRGAWRAAVHGVVQSRTWLKRLSMHACIGEGKGNPLQCSCLENPRDGAWWAAVYGVVQSQTRLKWLSSSSSSIKHVSTELIAKSRKPPVYVHLSKLYHNTKINANLATYTTSSTI